MSRMSRRKLLAAATASMALFATGAVADDYPTKPITMIIPLGAGGSHDVNGRVITTFLPKYLGQPVVVQLMPGGSGRIGTAAAAEAPADGYTLLFTHNFIDELQQHISKVPYDPNKDFVAVARTNIGIPSVVVRADSPFKTFKDLAEAAKKNPGKLKFGHSGNWGATMVPVVILLKAAGVKATLIPYKGGGPQMMGLIGGDVDFIGAMPSTVTTQGNKVRALVTMAEKRVFDDVPTSGEVGYPDVAASAPMHRVVLAPSKIPPARLAKLRDAFAKLAKDKDAIAMYEKIEENNEYMDGAAYEKLRAMQNKAYGELVKELTAK